MNKNKPLVSVLTTSWNREKYLRKLAKSLKKQTYQNFEWIISNDSSKDKTDEFIHKFSKKVNFKIVYIKSDLRVGKAKLTNIMMSKIKGKYTIECDSDDYFLPKTINNFIKLINDKNLKKNKKFAGMVAQNISTDGRSQTFKKEKNFENKLVEWENLHNIIDGDASIFALSKYYKNKKYLEVDFLINESSLLNKIFKNKKFLLTTKIMKIMDRRAKNSVSFGNKMQYTRASVYCIAMNETLINFSKKNFLLKIKTIINYWRYSLHGDVKFQKSIKMSKVIKNKIYYILLFPFSFLIFLIDKLRNKVEKTHIEFNKNIKNAYIDIKIFNGGQ